MKLKEIITKICLVQLFIFSSQTIFCQENYLQGQIFKAGGDTLRGFIDYRKWDFNPDNVFFKENLNGNRVKYSPLDIKGFSVFDEIYESAIINTEVSPMDISNLDYNSNFKLVSDTLFLQSMVQGKKSLYYYKNNIRKELFYIKSDSSFELLMYKKYLYGLDNAIIENRKYIGQLLLYLNDCKEIQSNLKETEYQQGSLEKLFNDYYRCVKSDMKFQKKVEKPSMEMGALAGLSLTSLKFRSNDLPDLENANFNKSTNFTAGLFLDVIVPGNHKKKWSLNNELMFSSYNVSGSYNNAITQITSYTTLGFSYLKMNNMVRFKYPIGGTFVYINIGITNGLIVSETNKMKMESLYRTLDYKAIPETKKWENGLLTGVGVKYKKYSFEIRYEKGNGISAYRGLGSSTKRYTLTLGYRFK
jgi:hypothetical protein